MKPLSKIRKLKKLHAKFGTYETFENLRIAQMKLQKNKHNLCSK